MPWLSTPPSKRQKLWHTLQDCLNHIPKTHYLVVLGDFNTVLRADPPFVGTEDPRRHHNVHSDSHVLQQLLRTQDLIAVNCKGGYQHTFTHGTHASRINYILIRQSQVQYRRMKPITNAQFERNFGIHGPHHHPLLVTLPKWHAPQPFHFPLNRIDRFAMRHAYQAQLDNWVCFEARARQLIHDMTSLPGCSAQDCMIALENQLRTLCIHYFPKRRSHRSAPSQLLSISSRMWNARREALRVQGKSLSALFRCWRHVTTFLVCHKQIRQHSRPTDDRNLKASWREGPTWPCTVRPLNGIARFDSSVLSKGFDVFRCMIRMICLCLQPRRYNRSNNTILPCTQMLTCHDLTQNPSNPLRSTARS